MLYPASSQTRHCESCPGSLQAIEKALNESDIGINPSNDGEKIRLNIPPLTQVEGGFEEGGGASNI